jgi:hypothetical protein
METIISVVTGAFVCLFGIWTFLKGQESMAEIITNGKPQNIKGPMKLIKEGITAAYSHTEDMDIEKQLQAMFSDVTIHSDRIQKV